MKKLIATALFGATLAFAGQTVVATAKTAPVNDGLPIPGFQIDTKNTALVITDPQVDFLSPKGVTWGVVGKSVTENNTVDNLEELFKIAEDVGMPTFVSPHYYFHHDHEWHFGGAIEKLMHKIGMFDRHDVDSKIKDGSGADWMPQYKKYINNGKTVVVNPHKVYGPETNDLVLQLRKRGIDKVILAGMSANLCTESHLRELVEQGFEVMIVTDATAAAVTEHYNGYDAAITNFRFIASKLDTTKGTVNAIKVAYKK